MPARTRRLPLYHHKPSNRARTRIELENGQKQDVYLGPWGSPEAAAELARLQAEEDRKRIRPKPMLVYELLEEYIIAHGLYGGARLPKNKSKIRKAVQHALDVDLLSRQPLGEIKPGHFEAFLDHVASLVDEKRDERGEVVSSRPRYVRDSCNEMGQIILRVFKWGERKGHAPIGTLSRLHAAEFLKWGQSSARESVDVRPVPVEDVTATIERATRVVSDMMRVQLWTGMRSDELCSMTPGQIDRSGDVWWYEPAQHKNLHRNQERRVPLGPQVQATLMRYLNRREDEELFSPRESYESKLAERQAARVTPASCGNRPGSNRSADPVSLPSTRYTSDGYRQAVQRAARAAGVPKWTPHQLRHTAATLFEHQHGEKIAQLMLGHASPRTTSIYVAPNLRAMEEVARKMG